MLTEESVRMDVRMDTRNTMALDGCTHGERMLFVIAHRGDAQMRTQSMSATAAFAEVSIMDKLAERG